MLTVDQIINLLTESEEKFLKDLISGTIFIYFLYYYQF